MVILRILHRSLVGLRWELWRVGVVLLGCVGVVLLGWIYVVLLGWQKVLGLVVVNDDVQGHIIINVVRLFLVPEAQRLPGHFEDGEEKVLDGENEPPDVEVHLKLFIIQTRVRVNS